MRLILIFLAAGCSTPAPYACTTDGNCVDRGQAGQCVSGFCAYSAPACPSLLRWSAYADPTVAGACVPVRPDAGAPDMAVVDAGSDAAVADMVVADMATPPDLATCGVLYHPCCNLTDGGGDCGPMLICFMQQCFPTSVRPEYGRVGGVHGEEGCP